MFALTRCACKNNPFIHFVYGNQNHVARGGSTSAKWHYREGMLALLYHFRKFNGASGWVYIIAVFFKRRAGVAHSAESRRYRNNLALVGCLYGCEP